MEVENLGSGCSLDYFILTKNSEGLLLDQLKESGISPSKMQRFVAKNAAEDRKSFLETIPKIIVVATIIYISSVLLVPFRASFAIGVMGVLTAFAAVKLKALFDAYALLQPNQLKDQGQAASLEKRVNVVPH